ncbi:hypothetical protein [Steroidobacter agaridevorans]|uniref:hypothetical protein n=1 Tax=Steroidobacter agaridevorans TaxID=2695856 RepID=UPI001321BE82|nr:hypothetical protein [Steroidobacter agaridevorans]GFE91728.1 hypothetical protein GCM10011488_66820 [Steroidobacter agaridevorans]
MSESAGVIPRTDETDTEIELSAQDLLALSDLEHVEEQATSPAPQPSKPAKSASPNKQGLILSLIAVVGIVGATYVATSSDGANPSVANPSQQMALSERPAPQQFAESKPVRFANPFDADEVFEFPPGTTETQARDAVADVLLKRAISRQET